MQVDIERMAHGPDGVGRLSDGRVAFVANTVPGDTVKIAIQKEHSRHVEAAVTRVINPSPERREPLCQHAKSGECGGCPWQHLSDKAQKQAKQETVAREIWRFAPDTEIRPITSPVPSFGYRRRTRLGHKGSVLGYRARGVRRIFDIAQCPVLDPRLESELDAVRAAVSDWPSGNVDLLLDDNGDVIVGGPAKSFRQPSAYAEDALIQGVMDAIPETVEHIAELFCGSGTFTVPLYQRNHSIDAWEMDKQALRMLSKKAPRVRTHQADLTKGNLVINKCDAVVLDPPRKGAAACLQPIIDSGAKIVCYVSCNIMTLCRDLRTLCDGGYRVQWVQPIDAFPQTHHIECIVKLIQE